MEPSNDVGSPFINKNSQKEREVNLFWFIANKSLDVEGSRSKAERLRVRLNKDEKNKSRQEALTSSMNFHH